jgi:hypothetical protein
MTDEEPTPEYDSPTDLKRLEVRGEVYYFDEDTRLLINIIDDKPIGYLDADGENINFLSKGEDSDDEPDDPINKYPDKDIPEQKLYDILFTKDYNIGDIFLILFLDDDKIIEKICEIESIIIEENKIILSGDDLLISELSIDSELNIVLMTDNYTISDIELITETTEKHLEDLSLKLSKEVIPDINFVDIKTDDKSYSSSEEKEELLSDLVYLLSAYNKEGLLKELTEISEYYLIMINECLKKNIENKEYLKFVTDIINSNKFKLPSHIQPIVSAKRNLYVGKEDGDEEEDIEVDPSVIVNSSSGPNVQSEIKELVKVLESDDTLSMDYKNHINVDMNDKFISNYKANLENKKFITKYVGSYLRDCIDIESCVGVSVDVKKAMFKDKTYSYLSKNYAYDDIKTREILYYPNLVSEKTNFEIIKDAEIINIVGFIFFHSQYLYKNLNLSLDDNIFSLSEISFLSQKSYSTEVFKKILNNARKIPKEIDDMTRYVEEYNDFIKLYYLKNVNDINLDSLGYILKNNIPDKREIIENVNINLMNSIYDIKSFERLVHNYDILINNLDKDLKKQVLDVIDKNIELYLSTYAKIVKSKEIKEIKVVRNILNDEKKSKKAFDFIMTLMNQKQKNMLLKKYIDRFLRSPGLNENKNYLYNKHDDSIGLCKHYIYDNDKFDEMLNIFGGDVKDGLIICKVCGCALCNEGFSPLQGFEDGRPAQTNEKMESVNTDVLTEIQEKNKQLIMIIQKMFNVKLNEIDMRNILEILDTIDSKKMIILRYSKVDDIFLNHPVSMELKKKYKLDGLKKKEKEKKRREFEKEKIKFHEYLHKCNLILSVFYLIILFIQTSVPSYGYKIRYEILNIDSEFNIQLINQSIRGEMLSYIESLLRGEVKKNSKDDFIADIGKLLNENTKGLDNIYNHFGYVIEYFKNNFLVVKRINKYKEYLDSGFNSFYLKETWSSYKPFSDDKMIQDINKQINDSKISEIDNSLENNSFIKEINKSNIELYKLLSVKLFEFMNNESYKRLIKYSNQIHGKSSKNILMINLLVKRLISTMDNDKIEDKFKKIGYKDGTIKNIDFREFKKIIEEEIPELYSKGEESGITNNFIYINKNNIDLKILAAKSQKSRVNEYIPTNIYPIGDYNTLKDSDNAILKKIFLSYCKDEFGNIIKRTKEKHLNYLLLDLDDSVTEEDNCHEQLRNNEENYLLFLKYLTNKNKLLHYPERFNVYLPFYDKDNIIELELNNIQNINPNKNINKFFEDNKYLLLESEYSYENIKKLYDLNNNIIDFEYLSDNTLNKKYKANISDIYSKLIEDQEYYKESLLESVKKLLPQTNNLIQIKRIETYYGLKSTAGLSGTQKMIDLKVNTISTRMIESLSKLLEKDNIKEKMNMINNLYYILSRLKNDHLMNTSLGGSFLKTTKGNLELLSEFFDEKEFLLHEDVWYKHKISYNGFWIYRDKGKYFKGLFNFIDGFQKNLDLLFSLESRTFLSEDINILINYVLLFILNKITEYIEQITDTESDVSKDAIIIFTLLEKDFNEFREETIKECSSLFIDLLQNMIEEDNDIGYLHENTDKDNFSRQLSKQKEREKSFLVSDLTAQSNEQRLLTSELQSHGLSNWFDNLSRRNDEYKKSEQFKIDAEEERIRRMVEMSESFENERDLYEKNGINVDELLAKQMGVEEELPEDLGYGGGKLHDGDPEDEEDETDGYDN